MNLATAAQTTKIENLAVKRLNVNTFWLMQRAGKGVAIEASRQLGNLTSGKIAIVCGSGNNGGDGLVAARHLIQQGIDVAIFSTIPAIKWIGDAGYAYSELKKSYPALKIYDLSQPASWGTLESVLRSCTLIIDSIFGFGLTRPVQGIEKKAIELINKSGRKVLSVDMPSGVNGDTGQIFGVAVRANKTLAVGIVKPGLLLYPGLQYTGEIGLIDIGLDKDEINANSSIKTVDLAEVVTLLPKRAPDVHKKSIGNVGVIAGSSGMTGAATLCVNAAMRSGAGIATLFCPRSLMPVFETKLTEAIKIAVPESTSGSISLAAYNQIEAALPQFDVLIVGPGLSRRPETVTFVRKLVMESEVPLVLDADAINALEGQKKLLSERNGPTVITPHPGEFSRLLGIDTDEVLSDALNLVSETANETGITIVLKGARTIIANTQGGVAINLNGNAGMATAGVGDVLTGLIGGLWAQGIKSGLSEFEAAKLGVYLHGLSGDLAAKELTQYSVIASDLIKFLPKAFKVVEKGSQK